MTLQAKPCRIRWDEILFSLVDLSTQQTATLDVAWVKGNSTLKGKFVNKLSGMSKEVPVCT